MAKEFFLYQVNRRWYRVYWAFMLVFNLVVTTVYIMAQFSDQFATYAGQYDIGRTAAMIAGVNIAYLAIFYWLVVRYSLPFATLVGSMLLGMGLLNGMANTDQHTHTLVYAGVWLISTFFSGLYGLPLLLGSLFLTYVYVTLHSNFQIMKITSAEWILLGGELVVAGLAYLFWRNRYRSTQEQQVNQLSGMLESNQQQSAVLIQSIADGVIVTNTEGKITLMNPAAAAMTEWPVNEATGVDVQLVLKLAEEGGAEIPAEENPFSLLVKQQNHVSKTVQLTGRDNKKETISLVVSPIINPETKKSVGSVAVMRDVSDERAAERQRADFISTASHEMRTPVAAIEGYLALALNEKVATIDERARGYLEKAHTSTQHLGKLFQDLLTSSKAEDGRLSNHPQVVEMGAFLQQLTDDLKFAAEKKGLFAEFLIGGANDAIDATSGGADGPHVLKPLYYVNVDPDRMREVVTNIFDNACKYTEQGKISIGLTGDVDVVQMYVKDTGDGIPAEDIPHLFQKFYRVDNSATRTIGGTGLGLFICRKIVELYRGRIWVESELSKGSTFFINLPRITTQHAAELQASEAAAVQSVPAAGAPGKA